MKILAIFAIYSGMDFIFGFGEISANIKRLKIALSLVIIGFLAKVFLQLMKSEEKEVPLEQ